MPEVANPLCYGGPSDWASVALKTPDYVRCHGCGGVYPGRHKAEVNPATMRCRECEAKGQDNEG
jgi:hypothetical protein